MPQTLPHSGLICVALSGATSADILAQAAAVGPHADVIEIRLDGMTQPAVAPFRGALNTPLLFTNRASWEGGQYAGTEAGRVGLLQEAVRSGAAAYVDIELKTDPALRDPLIREAREHGVASIVSWHNFTVTPSSQALRAILQEQYRSNAAVGKIVTMAQGFQDVLRVLDLQVEAAEMGLPLIAFCMGRAGVVSRVATLSLGGYMTYAAADGSQGTAPGQLAVSSLRAIVKELGHGA